MKNKNKSGIEIPKPVQRVGIEKNKGKKKTQSPFKVWSLQSPALASQLAPTRRAEFIEKIDKYVKLREDEPLAAVIKHMYEGLADYPDDHTFKLLALRKISEKVHKMIERECYEKARLDLMAKKEVEISHGLERLDFEKLAEPVSKDRGRVSAILTELRKVAEDMEESRAHGLWHSVKLLFSEIEKYVLEELDIEEFRDEFVVELPKKPAVGNSLENEFTIDFEKVAERIGLNVDKALEKKKTKKKVISQSKIKRKSQSEPKVRTCKKRS